MVRLLQPVAVLVLVFLETVHSESFDHRLFLWEIIEKYGYNGSISYEGFERLYTNLGLGNSPLQLQNNGLSGINSNASDDAATKLTRKNRDVPESDTKKTLICKSQEELAQLILQHEETPGALPPHQHPPPRQCLAPRELMEVYGLPHGSVLSPVSFLHLCPALIYQLDQPTCAAQIAHHHHHHSNTSGSTYSAWLYACLSILVISVSGLLCVSLVPLLQNTVFDQLIGYLVALAAGTLLGDALLHLIPHALIGHGGETDNHTDSVVKTGIIFLTVVFFFTFEGVLNLKRSKKESKKTWDNVNYVTVNDNQNEKEMVELGKAEPEVKSHGHSHAHSGTNTALIVVVGDGLHNLTDGLAIGAAFSGGLAPGFATAVAVFTHELPHELGDFAVLLQSGLGVRRALFFNLVSSVLSLIGALAGLALGTLGDATRFVYCITAGAFIYIALSNQFKSCTQLCS